MGDLSANLKAALAARSNRVGAWLLEVNWPDGTVRYSDAGWSSRTRGFYWPWVTQWSGDVRQATFDNVSSVQDVTFAATIADRDGAIKLRQGANFPAYQTTCNLFLAGGDDILPNQSDWYTACAGYLDGIDSPGRGLRQLQFRGLNVYAQAIRVRTVDVLEWPNADPGAVGQVIPRAWGIIEGPGYPGTKNGGACPTIYVDTVGFMYLVAQDFVDVTCVYKDGVALDFQNVSGSNRFGIVHLVFGANAYTLIDFAATQGTSVITCDLRGYDTNGDGTGTLIEAPLAIADDVLKRTLSPTGASILDVSNAASMPSPRMHARGFYYLGGGVASGVQLVSDLCRSFNMFPIQKGNGVLSFGSQLSWEGESTDPTAAPWLQTKRDQIAGSDDQADAGGAPPTQKASGIDLAAKVVLAYASRPTGGSFNLVAGDALARAGSVAVDQQTAPFLPVVSEAELDTLFTAASGSLRSWIEARSMAALEHNEGVLTGGVIQQLGDLSGNGRVWIPQVGGTFLRGEVSGLPAIQYNGSTQWLSGPNSNLLFGTTGFTFFLVVKLRSVAAAGADGTTTNDNILDTQTGDIVQLTASTLNGNLSLRVVDGSAHHCEFPYAAILGSYGVICCHFTGANAYIGVNETRLGKMGTVACGSLVGLSANPASIGARTTAANFSSINLVAAAFFNVALTESQRLQARQTLESRFVRYPANGIARSAASLRQLYRRQLRNKVTLDLDLSWLDSPLMSQVNVQDPDVPTAFPGVTGDQPWQRRPHLLAERSISPGKAQIGATLVDAQEDQVCLWISARADQTASGADRDRYPGLAVYPNVILEPYVQSNSAGSLVPYTSILEAPWSDQYALPIRPGRIPLSGPLTIPQGGASSLVAAPLVLPGGLWLMSAHLNVQTRSSMSNATPLTGLTLVGGGITADPADLLFDPSITLNSAKLVVTGGLDQTITWPTWNLGTNAPCNFSFDFKCDSGAPLFLRINSATLAKDYDPSTGLFSATAPFFFQCDAWAGHPASLRRGRFLARLPAPGTGLNTTVVKLLGSAGNGKTAHVYHNQVVPNGDPTLSNFQWAAGVGSRQINDAGTAIPGACGTFLRVYNGTGAGVQVWPVSRGTMVAEICLLWNAADITSDHPLMDVPYDGTTGNHYFRVVLEYNAGSPRVAFRVKGGAATEVIAAVPLTGFVVGDVIRVAARWTSSSGGELGLAANTCSVFVKKLIVYDQAGAVQVSGGSAVKGNDVVCTKPTPGTTSLNIGGIMTTSDATVRGLDGILLDLLVVPRCMPDVEIDMRA